MSSREDMFKAKIALQDSIRAEKDPKKKKAMQKRFDKMKIPIGTHGEQVRERDKKLRAKMPNVIEEVKKRNAALDSVKNYKPPK